VLKSNQKQLLKLLIMKIGKILSALAVLAVSFSSLKAQDAPKGFDKGKVVLADGSVVSGYVKEKIRSNASVTIINDTDKKKENYDGNELLAAEVGSDKFICVKGDFFKVINDGNLKFLQKSSDASNKPIYNGNQAVFANGTEGKPGDYFIYNNGTKQLKLVTKKTITAITDEYLAGCETAIAKARSAGDDMLQVGEAVTLYNSCNK
jgi:hypothetical protein